MPPLAPTLAAPVVNRTMNLREWTMLLALSVLWGGSFLFNGIAVKELPTLTIVVLRVGVGALILLGVLRLAGVKMPRDPKIWAAFFGMGFLNNVLPFSLIVWGQSHIASGLASILNATTPLFTVLLAHFLTRDEKMTGNRLAGVLVGFVGVVTLIGPAFREGWGTGITAQLACLAAAFLYGLGGIYGRRFNRMGVAPMATATGQVIASTILLLPFALFVDKPWLLPMPSAATWTAIAGIAALSTALAYVLFFRILSTAGATNLQLVTFLIPVSAILLGWLVLNEHLHARHFAGMALIGVGLAAIDGRLLRRLTSRL